MDKYEFIARFDKANSVIDQEHITKVLRKSIDACVSDGSPRGHWNLISTMEELAELSKEISKVMRDKGDYYDILQELGDVYLTLGYVLEICNIKQVAVNKAINVKLNKLEENLSVDGVYK